MKVGGLEFREVWAVDFEFSAPAGSNPTPICAVAWELSSGAKLRLWQDEVSLLATAPYACDSDCLCIAYYASAEVGCHLALGWPPPANILDLFAEFRCMTNGLSVPCGSGLLGALAYYGLNSIGAVEKDTMRDLAMRGGPWTAEEKQALLDYCESDVAALARLLPAMAPRIDMRRASGVDGIWQRLPISSGRACPSTC